MTARVRALLLLGWLCGLLAASITRTGGLFGLLFGLSLPPVLLFRLKMAKMRYPWPKKKNKTYDVLIITYHSLILLILDSVLFMFLTKVMLNANGFFERLAAHGGAYLLTQALALRLIRRRAAPTRLQLIAAALLALCFGALAFI